MDSAQLGFELRQEFGDREDEPEVENTYGSYGDYQLVGKGKVTNSYCGKFYGFRGCLNVKSHDVTRLDGSNQKGKVFVQRVFNSCDKASCPVCYKYGWATRQAGNIEVRLKEGARRFGLVEHIVASVPPKDYGLSLKKLRAGAIKALKVRGVVGGVLIFHAFRYNKRKQWYWSPHFHCLGFILGGYECRGCVKSCLGCKGFESRTRKEYKKDGYIVKVLGKRKTVFGTAWYQLHHSSVRKTGKSFHVATWFGACGYRKMKVTVEYKKRVCPLCQKDLISIRYSGNKRILVNAFLSEFDPMTERMSLEDYREDGKVVWVEGVERDYG